MNMDAQKQQNKRGKKREKKNWNLLKLSVFVMFE